MVAEAMAVQLPSKSAPVATIKPKRSTFWHIPLFGHRGPAYQSLKDVDSPIKGKGSMASAAANEDTDDMPLLKAGDPIKGKYQEKLTRRAASDDDETFVPNPNSKIRFQLPTDKSSEASPRPTIEPEIAPENLHADSSAAEDSPATVLISSAEDTNGPAAVSDSTAITNLMPANDEHTLV